MFFTCFTRWAQPTAAKHTHYVAATLLQQEFMVEVLSKGIPADQLISINQLIAIVSTVRQFWKLGAAVREPGARALVR
jgi:hypothetical protein